MATGPDPTPRGGPLWQPEQPCRWCGRALLHVWFDSRHDGYLDEAGAAYCTPADRGVQSGKPGHCVFGYYADPRVMGPPRKGGAGPFDPLTLSFHDGTCPCSVSFPHTPDPRNRRPYPWPNLVPEHCGQPMMLRNYHRPTPDGTLGGWHCRNGGTNLAPTHRGARPTQVVPYGCQVIAPAATLAEATVMA